MKNIMNRAGILLKVIPFVFVLVGLKLLVHNLNFEIISLNAIFSGIIGANVFLLGFLLSGVLSDFKESEKLPGEVTAIIYTISDELEAAYLKQRQPVLKEILQKYLEFSVLIKAWLHKQAKTSELMLALKNRYIDFNELEGLILPNYLARMKQEHNNIRKIIIRIHTIRETDFISSGYLIAVTTTVLLLTGLIFSKIEPFYESLFFVGVISYLMVFLIMLIRDLDNPFGYYENASSEDVSLKPLEDLILDLQQRTVKLS